MSKKFALVLFIFLAGQEILLAQKPTRPFTITFEEDGKEVVTNLRVRLRYRGKITKRKYSPGSRLSFPRLGRREAFDLWITSDKYTLPFLKIPGQALLMAGWRIGVDNRPFELEYLEMFPVAADVQVVYYMIYNHPDGSVTPILFESSKSVKRFGNRTAPPKKALQLPEKPLKQSLDYFHTDKVE
jgi:hypothetical protein